MPSSVQVTSMKIGNGASISKTFSNVDKLHYDFGEKNIQVDFTDGTEPVIIDIDGATTITHTISSKQHTVAIS